ncbi:UPF0146 family protein [Halolamina pelagica]|uniref:UPF0146 family protein n=1 Tax=Halolamina pelagica TaxID=699431 RepID=UPI001EFAD8AF|nr:UPF0146 family protein [Halolamina pelagica]
MGDRTGVAAGLVDAGADVRATDVHPVSVPDGVRFRVEDVTTVDEPDAFHRVDVVYALNCPPNSTARSPTSPSVSGRRSCSPPRLRRAVDPRRARAVGWGRRPRVTLYRAATREARR